jgi:hypothetical protein
VIIYSGPVPAPFVLPVHAANFNHAILAVDLADGTVIVAGGIPYDPHAPPSPVTMPKLSDRPMGLPAADLDALPRKGKSGTSPTPQPSKGKSPAPRTGPPASPAQVTNGTSFPTPQSID